MIATGNRAYGMEVLLREDGKHIYNFCEAEQVKGAIHLRSSNCAIEDIETLKPMLKKDFPVLLTINGKGVLSKELVEIKKPIIQQFFPGIAVNDFYFNISLYQNVSYAYIMRKKTVDDIIAKIQSWGLTVTNVALGLGHVFTALEVIGESISPKNINVRNAMLVSDASENAHANNVIQVDEDEIPVAGFPAYCSALVHYLPDSVVAIESEHIADNNRKFRSNQAITRYSLVFLGVILVVIMASTVINFLYSSKYDDLQAKGLVYANSNVRDSLVAQIRSKKRFLVEGNWVSASKSSFYADRLAATVSGGFYLTALSVFPPKPIMSDEHTAFSENVILARGNAGSELILKNWADELRKMDWVEGLVVNSYQWNSKSGEGEFELSIQIKE